VANAPTSATIDSLPLLAYASPAVALQAMMGPILLTLPALYAQELGVGVAAISVALILARAFEAISDPVIGALTDRTPAGPWQRAVWMVAGTPLAVLTGIALLHPPTGSGAGYLFVCLVLFYLGWTMVYIPYQSWGAELSDDFTERSRIAAFREGGSFIGYLLSAVVPLVWLVLILRQHAPSFGDQAKATGWFFTVSLPIFVAACLKWVPRRAATGKISHSPWSQMFALVGRNKPFLRLLVAYMFDRLALGIHFALLPFFMQYSLDMLSAFLLTSLVISIAPIISIPLWLALARRVGKHRAYCIANVITATGYAGLYFVPQGALALLMLTTVIRGFGNAGTLIMPGSMTADAIDYDDWRSGVRQAGAHIAFLTFVQKLGLAGGALGLAFAAAFGFKSAGGVHTAVALEGIRIGAAILPALLLIPSILLMWNFSLDERRQRLLRRRIERRNLLLSAVS
jgi:GPH family glycoside/pentoside/hexuronide:cation symporter